jgi:hypothetical protein
MDLYLIWRQAERMRRGKIEVPGFLSQKPGWALHCIESGAAEGSEESRLIFICFVWLVLVAGAGAAQVFSCVACAFLWLAAFAGC